MDTIKSLISDKWNNFTTSTSNEKFKITGDVPYIIDINITGAETYTNSVLTVNAFSKGGNKIAIAIQCKWSRKYNNTHIPLPIKTNTYQLSALDAGSCIVIEIESMELDLAGKAQIEFGPINLNPSIR